MVLASRAFRSKFAPSYPALLWARTPSCRRRGDAYSFKVEWEPNLLSTTASEPTTYLAPSQWF